MRIIFTLHASQRMRERNISKDEVCMAIQFSGNISRQGYKFVAKSLRKNGHLLMVYYTAEYTNILKIITVITTSKVHKYL